LIAKFDEIGLWMIATLLGTLQKWKTNAMDVNGCVTQWFFWTNFVIFQQNHTPWWGSATNSQIRIKHFWGV
jgi:hypothetical protein